MITYTHLDEHDMSLVRLVTGTDGQAVIEELSLGSSHSIRLNPEAQERLCDALGQHLGRPLLPAALGLDEMQAILRAAGYGVTAPALPEGSALAQTLHADARMAEP